MKFVFSSFILLLSSLAVLAFGFGGGGGAVVSSGLTLGPSTGLIYGDGSKLVVGTADEWGNFSAQAAAPESYFSSLFIYSAAIESLAFGHNAGGGETENTAFGVFAQTAAQGSTAIGANCSAISNYSTVIGYSATADHISATAIGSAAGALGHAATALGVSSLAWSKGSVALGASAEVPAGFDYAVELGAGTAALPGGLNFRGRGILTSNFVLVGDGSGLTNLAPAAITPGTSGQFLITTNGAAAWASVSVINGTNGLNGTNGTNILNALTNGQIKVRLAGVNTGIQLDNMFEKIVVISDSKMCRLGNPFGTGANKSLGWCAFGAYTNSSLSGTVTNQPDGTVWFNTGAYATNNLSVFEIWTNQIFNQSGYVVQLDTAACVPGQTAGNAGMGYPSYVITADQTGQWGNYSYNAAGTNTMLVYGYSGAGTVTWFPSSTNDLYMNLNGVNYTNYGTNVTITATWANNTFKTATYYGTPLSNSTARILGTIFAGAQNKYAPPYRNGSIIYGATNVSTSVWIASNAPAITGKRTALFVGTLGGNDLFNGNSGPLTVNYTPWDSTIGWSNRVDYLYTNLLYCCRVGRTNGLYPIFLSTYTTSYNFYNGQGGGAVGTLSTNLMLYLNNRIRSTPISEADFVVDFEAGNVGNTSALGIGPGASTNYIDGVHYTSTFATNQASQFSTNTGFCYLKQSDRPYNITAAGNISAIGTYSGNGSGLTNIAHTLFECGSLSNNTATINPAAGTWTQVTNSLVLGNVAMAGWTVATNALIYTNTQTVMVHSAVTLDCVQAASAGVVFFKVYQNGSPINSSMTRQTCQNTIDASSTALHPTFMVNNGDRFQLYVMSTSSGNVTVQDMNWVTFFVK